MAYKNFEFNTTAKLASNKGLCRGMVNESTGEITAHTYYGINSYSDKFHGNISDHVNNFPYTENDMIILNARKALAY